MQTITSTELQRNLSLHRDRAKDTPVVILERGEPKTVMMSYEFFQELMSAKMMSRDGDVFTSPDELEFSFLSSCYRATFPGEDYKKVLDVYERLERLISLVPIDNDRFEIGGYVFTVKAGEVVDVELSDWIKGDDMEEFRISLGVRLQGFHFREGRLWGGKPTQEDLDELSFVPAVLGLYHDLEKVHEWVAHFAYSSVFFDEDHDDLKDRFKHAAQMIILRNQKTLKTYSGLNLTSFASKFNVTY